MLVTPSGTNTHCRLPQSQNVLFSMLKTPRGMFALVKATQFAKALNPMLVTLWGIVTPVRRSQP